MARKTVRRSRTVAKKQAATRGAPKATGRRRTKPALLAGGNPQIAKAVGDAPVQAYLAAMPGWRRDVGRRLDALIARAVPGVRKAVKWNSPFYGVDGESWFLSFHTFTNYVKVAFFRGASLRPMPPGASKDPNTRYLDIREGDGVDELQVTAWIQQAAALPGWSPSTTRTAKPTAGARRDTARTPDTASQHIDRRIRELADWRGAVLARMRALIHDADPDVVEEWKWQKASSPGTPVWSHHGGITTGEVYKEVVKLTFFHGAALKDPARLFNASLEGHTRRAIDIRSSDAIDEGAFRDLIRAAVAFNAAKGRT